MNFAEYVATDHDRYESFAHTLVSIIAADLKMRSAVTPPLFTRSRAKDPLSLQRKIDKEGLENSQAIETKIKDLAGCRLVFNTHGDVDAFLQSRCLF